LADLLCADFYGDRTGQLNMCLGETGDFSNGILRFLQVIL